MSEYQYYEWQTIDRLLTPEEQAKVNRLSSHISVTPTRAVVTYAWGIFKHDPRKVLLKYFDAHLYMTNWGSRQLIFRFPKGLLDGRVVEQYSVPELVSFHTLGEYQVLEISVDNEEDEDWVEGEGVLSTLARLRDDLLEGDLRLLYLAWLKAISFRSTLMGDEADTGSPVSDLEPPVPAGLNNLSPALNLFIEVFDLDPFQVQAAAANSPDLPPTKNYRELVRRMPREECDDFLVRLAEGEPGAALRLRRRLADFVAKAGEQLQKRRSIQQIFAQANHLQLLEQQRIAEEKRRKHIAAMKKLAKSEEQIWTEVEQEIMRFTASGYDKATALLEKLEKLAEFQARETLFTERVLALSEKYKTRRAILERWRDRGWL